MKKLFIALVLISSLSHALIPNEKITKFLNNRDVVLQVLGAIDFYTERCNGLTEVGGHYYSLALDTHGLTQEMLYKASLYRTGYKLAMLYPSCQKMASDFNNFGIGHFVKQ